MKKIIAHFYVLASAYTMAYVMVAFIIVAAALTLHFIFWVPLGLPPSETIGIVLRFIAVVAAAIVIVYSRSVDYRESIIEYLQR